jgi:hypothetical protein
MRELLGILAAAALGATAMYLLDPELGAARRRRLLRRASSGTIAPTLAGFGAASNDDARDDALLRERVRSRVGRLVSFPGAIHVQVEQRVVRLSGDVLAKEQDGLLSQVRDMPGVLRVINALSAHDSADGLSGLPIRQQRAGLAQV